MASTSGKRDDANSITVICGDLLAVYLIKENRVLYDGKTLDLSKMTNTRPARIQAFPKFSKII